MLRFNPNSSVSQAHGSKESPGIFLPVCNVLGCNLKNDRMISVHSQSKPFNITVIQVYAPTSNAEDAEVEQFYEDLQDLLELNSQKMSFSS